MQISAPESTVVRTLPLSTAEERAWENLTTTWATNNFRKKRNAGP